MGYVIIIIIIMIDGVQCSVQQKNRKVLNLRVQTELNN